MGRRRPCCRRAIFSRTEFEPISTAANVDMGSTQFTCGAEGPSLNFGDGECLSLSRGHSVLYGVILSGAVLQAKRRACPERSRRNLPRVTARGDSSLLVKVRGLGITPHRKLRIQTEALPGDGEKGRSSQGFEASSS